VLVKVAHRSLQLRWRDDNWRDEEKEEEKCHDDRRIST